jgi:hypothetical protein
MALSGKEWLTIQAMYDLLHERRKALMSEIASVDELLNVLVNTQKRSSINEGETPVQLASRTVEYARIRRHPIPLDVLYDLLVVDGVTIGGIKSKNDMEVLRIKLNEVPETVTFFNKFGYWPTDDEYEPAGYKGKDDKA